MTPAVGMGVMADFHQVAPDGVALALAQVSEPIVDESIDELTRVGQLVADASKRLLMADVDSVVWNTASASLMGGYGYDQGLIKQVEAATALPSTTASTAMVKAFKALGVSKIGLATPYPKDVDEKIVQFLRAHGVEVVACKGLGVLGIKDLLNVTPADMIPLVEQVNTPDAQAVYISNAALPMIHVLEALEEQCEKPVISTNQASLWDAFKLAGINDQIDRYGQLLRC